MFFGKTNNALQQHLKAITQRGRGQQQQQTLPVVKEEIVILTDNNGDDYNNSQNNRSHTSSKRLSHNNDDNSNTDMDSGTGGISQAKSVEMDNDSKCLKTSRLLILISLLLTGIIAGGVTYYFVHKQEMIYFEGKANFYAYKIEGALKHKSKTFKAVMHTMAVTVASHARVTSNEWPFETFPFYESVASQFRNVSGTGLIIMAPVVRGSAEKDEWSLYSVQHQDWVEESYATTGWTGLPYPIRGTIYDTSSSGVVYVSMDDLTMPLWQMSEPPKDTGIINYNLLSNIDIATTYANAAATKQGQLGPVTDLGLLVKAKDDEEHHHHSESFFVQPVLELNGDDDSLSSTVVASLIASLRWDTFFSNLYNEAQGGEGMILVVNSTCPSHDEPDIFTYELRGDHPVYLGEGDLHDPTYSDMVHHANFFTESDVEANDCSYVLSIYPSETVESYTMTNEPVTYAIVMTMLFLAAAIFFLVYDYLVQRRQREAVAEAARSNAIVASLFPAEIADRLLNSSEHDPKQHRHNGNSKLSATGMSDRAVEKMADGMGQKFRLKSYLDEEGQEAEKTRGSSIIESKPIADLFPNTTVLFADIAGFTAWSSVREPSQVFTLLETVYKAFDKTAKRLKVFKVETVGDCYVAVTGLPEPVKDHAVIMCRFARECLTQFNQLASQLEVILGPDTGDLNVRVGIHSGAVTAGVLRGDKSRFQLFGDTVNTAARIESTGTRDRIHLSHETAELLHAAGKSNWMLRRTDTIVAKGKGEMQTYWLLTDKEIESGINVEASNSKTSAPLPIVKALQPRLAKTTMDVLDPESSLPPKIKRLVDWNVDVLKRLLKQIVAKRNAESKEKFDMNHPLMMKHEMTIGSDTYVLSEVSEIIVLPDYSNVKLEVDPNKVILPEGVEQQLRLYVSSIAAMHRDNPFHNFEHASHVMMSVSKLLSRIVAPDEVLQDNDDGGKEDQLASNLHDHTYGITSDPLTQFSVVLAALIHDVDHSGVSNAQLIKEGAKIAKVFKQKSVAEQNSIVLAWDRLMESRLTALRGCIYSDPEELKRFRQLMVNTVMATDIFDKELSNLRKNRWDRAFLGTTTDLEVVVTPATLQNDRNRKATIVIEHLIQASDVAHTMQHWHIYQKWNERLFAEMMHAYQHGRLGFDPAEVWYKGEIGFFDNYIIPLAKKLKECGVFGVSSDEYLNYATENRREWEMKGEDVVKKMIAKYSTANEEDGSAPVDAPLVGGVGGKQQRGDSIKA